MPLAAGYWPCLRDIVVDVDICGPMCLDLRESVCNVILKYGYYPHQVAEDTIVSAIVKPEMVAFDIGANIGWYSCLMHRLTEGRGLIVAVEPMPRALRLLRKSAESRPTLQVIPCAIGEASGFAHLCEAKLLDVSQVQYSRAGEVGVVTIDDLAARFGHPDVIKIDVEGAELMAFRGAVQTLSNTRPPFILFEYIPTNTAAFGAYTLTQLVETLRPGNYSTFRLSHDAQLHPIDGPNIDGHLTNDYLAVPPGRLCEVSAFDAVEVN
jgi:FkbM family methyltransferase